MNAAPANAAAMAPPEHARMARRETLTCMLVNAALASAIVWVLYRNVSPIPLWGPAGGVFGFLPGTFMFTLLFTAAITLVVRGRVRSGAIRRLGESEGPGLGAMLPRNVALRALALALACTIVLVPLAFGLLWLLSPAQLSFGTVLALNVAYFVLLAAVVTPIAVWRAMRD